MLVASYQEETLENFLDFSKRIENFADLIEIRVDLLKKFTFENLEKLIQNSSFDILLTLRSKKEGGGFNQKGNEKLLWVEKCLACNPKIFDVEVFAFNIEILKKLKEKFPKVEFLASYHGKIRQNILEEKDFENLFQRMKNPLFCGYKIALKISKFSEIFLFLLWIQKKNFSHENCTGIVLGERFRWLRLFDLFLKNPLHFFSLKTPYKKMEGHYTKEELESLFYYQAIDAQTKFFGLIGKNLEASHGEIFHNLKFFEEKRNARYIKIELIEEKDFYDFFESFSHFPFSGFSITSPYKKNAAKLPFLEKKQNFLAVNTLFKTFEGWKAENTDLKALLFLLKKEKFHLKNKKILMVGTGATAEVFAKELKQHGARVEIESRSKTRKRILAKAIGVKKNSKPLNQEFLKSFDILIYTIPGKTKLLSPKMLFSHHFLVDIRWPSQNEKMTDLVKAAKKLKYRVIDGPTFFKKQAILQQELFFKKR